MNETSGAPSNFTKLRGKPHKFIQLFFLPLREKKSECIWWEEEPNHSIQKLNEI